MPSKKRKPIEALDTVLDAGRAVNVSELAEELLSAFGGPREFAKDYHTEYKHGTKPGGIARSKMLDGVLRIVASAGAQNKDKTGSVDSLTDEQLAEELVRILRKRGVSIEVKDAPKEETAPAS